VAERLAEASKCTINLVYVKIYSLLPSISTNPRVPCWVFREELLLLYHLKVLG
jgi:hypothetical protein